MKDESIANYFATLQPSQVLPDTFKTSQDASMSKTSNLASWTAGMYYPYQNKIELNTKKPLFSPKFKQIIDTIFNPKRAYGHELGHAVYFNELNGMDAKNWQNLMAKYTENIPPPKNEASQLIFSMSTSPIYRYYGEPWHQFADFYADYINNPAQLQKSFPDVYNFIKDKAKFEYSRKVQ